MVMEKILETERLVLREMGEGDYGELCRLLQDRRVMYAYEGAFSGAEVREWLERQLERYRRDGFGLWAVVRKADGEWLGQCGITLQEYGGGRVPEIGYLLRYEHWHRGYATEAAVGCREYGFCHFGFQRLYSIIRDTNTASQRVALRNGMREVGTIVKHYRGVVMPHRVFCVEWPIGNPPQGQQ